MRQRWCRLRLRGSDLAESLDRIHALKEEQKKLLAALRSVTGSPDFDAQQHGDVLAILSKYSSQDQSESGHDTSSQSRSVDSLSKQARERARSRRRSSDNDADQSGEDEAGSSAGSTGNKGELEHVIDLDGGCGATGFIGKMSDIAWIRRAFEMVRPDDEGRPGSDVDRPDIPKPPKVRRDYSYFIDETDVLAVDEDIVNPYEWPPGNAAVILTEAHFHAMQGTFQFVLREDFLQKLATFRLQASLPSWSERRWLAVANLVWAIGARWLEATKLDQSIQIENHLVYYARARALGIDHRVLIDHPDIERVQGIGLTAFYLLVNGSVTRAWNSLGHAIRHATALGLHLRVSDPSLSEASRECRARTWYSLYSLEILLSEITGRPKAISCAQVTIPIEVIKESQEEALESTYGPDVKAFFNHSRNTWLDFIRNGQRGVSQSMTGGAVPWRSLASVGQVISSSHLPQRLYLCRLSDKIGFQMYSETSDDSWSETQRKIGDLQSELKDWADKLPEELRMQSDVSVNNDPRVKLELSMYYHSLHMILHRACLCDVVIGHESARSQEFNRSSARACVHAAMSMMAMLPDYPSAHEAFQLLPWWTLLHYLSQAIAVLLLELALDTQHLEDDEVKELNNHLRKGMAYVWCLAECSLSAYRAWRIFRRLLSDLQDKHPAFDMVDIPLEAPRPAEWSKEHEAALRATLE
ncbi:Transcription regulator galc [Exophiala dermatitidis]